MATIYDSLYAYLSTKAEITALADDRGYPNVIPQDVDYPAWAYQQISGSDKLAHDGPANFHQARYQITCVAETYRAAQGLALEIQAALDGFTGEMGSGVTVKYCYCENLTDGYNTGTRTHTVRIDAVINYIE